MQKYPKEYFEESSISNYHDGYETVKGVIRDQFTIVANKYIACWGGVENKTHIDLGCAFGFGCELVNEMGINSTGVDISEYAISRAKDLHPDIKFINGDISKQETWNQLDNYDIATVFEIFEHMSEGDIQSTLEFISKRVKTGIFVTALDYSPHVDNLGIFYSDKTHITCRTYEWWISKLAEFGRIDNLTTFDLNMEFYHYGIPELNWCYRTIIVEF